MQREQVISSNKFLYSTLLMNKKYNFIYLIFSEVSSAFREPTSTFREMSPQQVVSCRRSGLAGSPLVSVHDVFTFLSDLDDLFNPPCSDRLMADDRRSVPISDVIFSVELVGDRRFVLL